MRALLLGNSQLVCDADLPAMVARLARSGGVGLEVDAVAIGGATIRTLWDDGRPLAALRGGRWDRVLVHEIIASRGGNRERLGEYAARFAGEARGARLVVYASGDVDGRRDTHERMYADALAVARAHAGRVAGGGMAWLRAWRERPELDLHHRDRAHPNERGCYLNACVVFAALTDRSPVGRDACGIAAADAAFFQRLADEQAEEDRRREAAG